MTQVSGIPTRLCYEDLAGIPPDGKSYEILEGSLHVTPAPSPIHQRVGKRLQRQLEAYFEARGLGEVFNAPVDVILSDQDVAQPDMVVVTNPAQVSQRGIEGAPLLLVEVLSPSSVRYDRIVKARRYAAMGVPHYWIVDVEAHVIECYVQTGERYELVARVDGVRCFSHPAWPEMTIDTQPLWEHT
jgi:Uma2 family endonuclease